MSPVRASDAQCVKQFSSEHRRKSHGRPPTFAMGNSSFFRSITGPVAPGLDRDAVVPGAEMVLGDVDVPGAVRVAAVRV